MSPRPTQKRVEPPPWLPKETRQGMTAREIARQVFTSETYLSSTRPAEYQPTTPTLPHDTEVGTEMKVRALPSAGRPVVVRVGRPNRGSMTLGVRYWHPGVWAFRSIFARNESGGIGLPVVQGRKRAKGVPPALKRLYQ